MTENYEALIWRDHDKKWLHFRNPLRFETAYTLEGIPTLLARVEAAVEGDGLWAAGFVSYEAAAAFDNALVTHTPDGFPLACFALYRKPEELSSIVNSDYPASIPDWDPLITRPEYDRSFQRIKELIASGDTYQVNYTFQLAAELNYDPRQFFDAIVSAQPPSYAAYMETPDHTICSFSPELFFERHGHEIQCRPMKGTAPRGLTYGDDLDIAETLLKSEKNRAENVMIVDMVRNDLGRIAVRGSVAVPDLWSIEQYPSIWQMVSTVTAETKSSLTDVFKALFPCASITGAPKARTMEIIRELEPYPRHLYTGCIGYLAPGNEACFNVAIRTVTVEKKSGLAEYGVGGGIVWDSTNRDEYDECHLKARVLVPVPHFSLLETVLWERREGYFLLDRHLERLQRSATYFNYYLSSSLLEALLEEKAENFTEDRYRVRILVEKDGTLRIEETALYPDDSDSKPFRVLLADEPVDRQSPFLYHKTTQREVYEAARKGHADCDDVLLFNGLRELTESTIANIVLEIDGVLCTPPVDCGLLAGTFRQELLECGEIVERTILFDDLRNCDALYLINSVRKWKRAVLVG